MVLQASGAISLEQVRVEGNHHGHPIAMSQYYAPGSVGAGWPVTFNNNYKGPGGGIPQSGQISMSQFWGFQKNYSGTFGPEHGNDDSAREWNLSIPQHGRVFCRTQAPGGGGGCGTYQTHNGISWSTWPGAAGSGGSANFSRGGGCDVTNFGGGGGSQGGTGGAGGAVELRAQPTTMWVWSPNTGNKGGNGSGIQGGSGGDAVLGGGTSGRTNVTASDAGAGGGGGGGGAYGSGGGGGGGYAVIEFAAYGPRGFGVPFTFNLRIGERGDYGSNTQFRGGEGGSGNMWVEWSEW
jgi:hypothetical protein